VLPLLSLLEAALTDPGKVRETNEDAFGTVRQPPAAVRDLVADNPALLASKGHLYVVCDGVGGYAAGEVASQMAVEIIFREYYSDPAPQPADRLRRAIAAANTAIHELASRDTTKQKMASTVVAAVVGPAGGQLTIAHAGDSRAYLYRDNLLRQLTQDHSWVAEQVQVGLLKPEQARRHAYRNVITRALGVAAGVNVEINEQEQLLPADRLLLCSDGLHSEVTSDKIAAILRTTPNPQEAVARLIAEARKHGGHDNITAVLVTLASQPALGATIPAPVGNQGSRIATPTVPRLPTSSFPILLAGVMLLLACLWINLSPSRPALRPIFTPPSTPTPTATATPSPMETLKPTSTLAPTSTSTPTPTNTLIPTNTSTSTPTRTSTPKPTGTFTPVPTAARTLTATPSLSPTMTYTVTPTFASSRTPTNVAGQTAPGRPGRPVCCPGAVWLPLATGLVGTLRLLRKSGGK